MFLLGLAALSVVACATPAAAAGPDLRTTAERSKSQRTGRYDEVERLCAAYQETYPKAVRCFELGRTPEGRPMLALAASSDGVLDPDAARAAKRPVAVVQGGIHAGEIDGKDAGFRVLRALLDEGAKGPLARATLVFVPVFNVDGHERFGRFNRPNQVGPEEMGFRTTAQNLNLNRDYVKAEAPEMQAMLRLLGAWDPILYVDLHVTDGANFEHDISVMVAPTLAGDADLRTAGLSLQERVIKHLEAHGSLPLAFYPDFVRTDDPSSGFAMGVSLPRYSQQYWAARNRIGVLVEAHSWKDYATRVRATEQTLRALLDGIAADGARWLDAARAADARASALGGTDVPLAYQHDAHSVPIAFRGYAYTREPSPISGALVTRYDSKKPQIWRVPLYDHVAPSLRVRAPRGGYLVPAAHARWVADKLALHGIAYERIAARREKLAVRTFRATRATPAPSSFEGRTGLTLEGSWRDEQRDVPAGSLFVPIAQPRAALMLALFEPSSTDALVSWGFFSSAFERKEYMEPYVAEEIGAAMLARDPVIRAEFLRKLATEPEFARSPEARLEFFHRKHASWDEAYGLYPIYQIDAPP
ncbi:MAG: M14 family metallopeptidase [Polyangiales bacterium]